MPRLHEEVVVAAAPSSLRPYWRSACGGYEVWHADCKEVLARLPDASVDFVFTDPPYGHNNNNGDLIQHWEKALGKPTKKPHADLIIVRERALGAGPPGEARPILNDGVEANELVRWSFHEWNRLLPAGACCACCCCGGGPDPQFARWSLWLDEAIGFKQMVIWDKGPMGMGWHYRRSYETVLVGEKPGAACRWYDTSCAVENVIRPNSGSNKIIPRADQHPTEKPVGLGAHFIKLHTHEGDLVIDPFCGSGTTGVACVNTGRRFVGVELDLHWCKVAVGRIQRAMMEQGLTFATPVDEMMDTQPMMDTKPLRRI